MKKIILLLILIFPVNSSISQTPYWQTLPNAPSSSSWRLDDLSFVNEYTGWVVSNSHFGGGSSGKVYKTVNGGINWEMQFSIYNVYLRCIGFTDSLNGWIGTLGSMGGLSRTPILYKTTDGGANWDSVTFSIDRPNGLCGMSVLNGNHIFACGRVSGPAYFIKTTNGGVNWISQNMNSYASELVDCKFFTEDSGFVVGSVDSKGLILFTSDGGVTWTEKYRGDRPYDGLWKISFPTRLIGYVSINGSLGTDSLFVIKTIDGGLNWTKIGNTVSNNATQGIGFLNENTGWAGGFSYPYKTTDGGLTWEQDFFGMNLNRIRFLSDTLGFAVGRTVYKYSNETVGIKNISNIIPDKFILYQNYPNPFNPVTKIKFDLPSNVKGQTSNVKLVVYDALGKEVTTLVNERLDAGSYEAEFNGSNYSSGLYFYKLEAGNFSEVKRMMLLK